MAVAEQITYDLSDTLLLLAAEPARLRTVRIPVSRAVVEAFDPPLESALRRLAGERGIDFASTGRRSGGRTLEFNGGAGAIAEIVAQLDRALKAPLSVTVQHSPHLREMNAFEAGLTELAANQARLGYGISWTYGRGVVHNLFTITLQGPLTTVAEVAAAMEPRLGINLVARGRGGTSLA